MYSLHTNSPRRIRQCRLEILSRLHLSTYNQHSFTLVQVSGDKGFDIGANWRNLW